jgi:hypothetical protein
MGDWYRDRYGQWRWDDSAPAASAEATQLSAVYRGATMNEPETPLSVLDPSIGADGGGHPDAASVPVFDDEGREPAMARFSPDLADDVAEQTWATPTPELVACPCCGTGVHPDRIRD